MAQRKSSKIVSAWLGTAPSKNIRVVGKTSVNNQNSSEAKVDTGGGEKDKVNETLILGIAGAAGVTAATVGLRASGLPARLANTLKGQTVGLHGSPVPGLKSIDPRISRSDTDIPTVSFVRTDIPPFMKEHNVNITKQYANKAVDYNMPLVRSVEGLNLPPDQGSIYVVKANKATSNLPNYKDYVKNQKAKVKYNAEGRPMLHFPPTAATKTTTSAKVFAEIPVNKYPTEDLLNAEIRRQTRLAGSSMRTKSLRDKIEEAARKKAMKQRDKKSVI